MWLNARSLIQFRNRSTYLSKEYELSELPREHEEHIGNAQCNQAPSTEFRGPGEDKYGWMSLTTAVLAWLPTAAKYNL